MDSEVLVIMGAGGIGGTLAAELSLVGDRVVVVDASPEHVEAMCSDGLLFEGLDGQAHQVRFEETLHPSELHGSVQQAIIAVKSMHTLAAANALAPHLADDGFVVSLQNGWNPERIGEIVGMHRVLGGMVHMVGNHLGPGHVRRYSEGAYYVGELDGTMSQRAIDFAARLSKGVPAEATDNVWGFLWSKQILGITRAPAALVNAPSSETMARDEVRTIMLAMVLEGMAAAAAEGVRLEKYESLDPEVFAIWNTHDPDTAKDILPRGSKKGNSGLWQDLRIRRRKTEADYMGGELVRIAARHGLELAVVRRTVEIVLDLESGKRDLEGDYIDELVPLAEKVVANTLKNGLPAGSAP